MSEGFETIVCRPRLLTPSATRKVLVWHGLGLAKLKCASDV